ncbi:MAG: trimeric intracellular cation channel family protein [Dehalococcoidia bacterium]
METWITVLDRAGIVAFAFAGVEVGVSRRMDVFGLLVMGLVTALGGGIIRDMLLGDVPLAFERTDYLLWALGAAAGAIVLAMVGWRLPRFLVALADAGGLGVFAVAGALAATEADLGVLPAALLAILTATGGGVVRDLLAMRLPAVLWTEVNATAAAAGGVVAWSLEGEGRPAAVVTGVGVTAVLALAGRIWDLHLPVPRPRER